MCLLDNSEINRACYWKEKTASSQLVHLISNLHEAYTWIWFGGKFKTQNFRNFGSSVCKHEMSSWESESAIELSWLCLTFPSSILEIWRLTKTPNIESIPNFGEHILIKSCWYNEEQKNSSIQTRGSLRWHKLPKAPKHTPELLHFFTIL